MQILKYFVECVGLKCSAALNRALYCNDLEIANYLFESGSQLTGKNYVYSIKCIRWAFQHNAIFDKDAFNYIITNNYDRYENDRYDDYTGHADTVDNCINLLFQIYPDLKAENADEYTQYLARLTEKERIQNLPYRCINCDSKTDSSSVCSSCNKNLCEKCCAPNEFCINKTDWLLDLENICIKCNKVICSSCMWICYECTNIGDTDNCDICYTCKKCTQSDNVFTVDCPYHIWQFCNKHNRSDATCGECSVNCSYHLKMTL